MSFPPGTEMFQFPGLTRESRDRCLWGGSPEHIAAFNARSRRRLGIPPMPLGAWPRRPGPEITGPRRSWSLAPVDSPGPALFCRDGVSRRGRRRRSRLRSIRRGSAASRRSHPRPKG
jgi:hypothetical protein